ncbi:MAG TPA: hypothetical protein DGG95_09195 [Cytophagales bacterium]|jgi:hypothetical protein|nr:hypothetical protein [Cytophagales bacterium]
MKNLRPISITSIIKRAEQIYTSTLTTMKFNTFLFSRLNIFSPSYVLIENGYVSVVTKQSNETVHVKEIRFVDIDIDIPKIGFSTIDLVVGVPERKISIYGFTKKQCEEIYTAINTCQISNYKFNPLNQFENFIAMESLIQLLKSISKPRKFELPLIQIIASKVEEGLNITEKLRYEKWEKVTI